MTRAVQQPTAEPDVAEATSDLENRRVKSVATSSPELSARLAERVVRGDREALTELFERTHRRVWAYLRALGAPAPLAEDVSQRTFVRVLRFHHTFRTPASGDDAAVSRALVAWVLRIARNELFNDRRSAAVRRESSLEQVAEGARDDRLHGRTETQQTLRRLLQRLPIDQREAVVLLRLRELTATEAAEVLGAEPGTVRVRAHRGLRALRRMAGVLDAQRGREELP